ncbi:MAG: hypothetical protein ACREP6_02945 [Candidatus Binataceae bacterium]
MVFVLERSRRRQRYTLEVEIFMSFATCFTFLPLFSSCITLSQFILLAALALETPSPNAITSANARAIAITTKFFIVNSPGFMWIGASRQ